MMENLEIYKKELNQLKKSIRKHSLFSNKLTNRQIAIFMESHIYSVWGFMSLLKSLQYGLSSNNLPWIPTSNTTNGLINFINEIVLSEESEYIKGIGFTSHFEIYLLAMKKIGAKANEIKKLIKNIEKNKKYKDAILDIKINKEVKDFLDFDIKTSQSNSLPKIIGGFTLAREQVIPNMFEYIIPAIKDKKSAKYFITYLKRHITIDGDRHGPLATRLLKTICTSNNDMCIAYKSGIKSLKLRLKVWDKVASELKI